MSSRFLGIMNFAVAVVGWIGSSWNSIDSGSDWVSPWNPDADLGDRCHCRIRLILRRWHVLALPRSHTAPHQANNWSDPFSSHFSSTKSMPWFCQSDFLSNICVSQRVYPPPGTCVTPPFPSEPQSKLPLGIFSASKLFEFSAIYSCFAIITSILAVEMMINVSIFPWKKKWDFRIFGAQSLREIIFGSCRRWGMGTWRVGFVSCILERVLGLGGVIPSIFLYTGSISHFYPYFSCWN